MRRIFVFLMSLCVGAGSLALAADPPVPSNPVEPGQPATPAATAATLPATAVLPAESSAGAAKTDAVSKSGVPEAKSGVSEAQAKAMRLAGYKVQVRNGQTLYCRSERQLGTRFESKVCGTAEEIARSTANSQELAERIQTKAFVKAPGSP
jgi:hypothetical protein